MAAMQAKPRRGSRHFLPLQDARQLSDSQAREKIDPAFQLFLIQGWAPVSSDPSRTTNLLRQDMEVIFI